MIRKKLAIKMKKKVSEKGVRFYFTHTKSNNYNDKRFCVKLI